MTSSPAARPPIPPNNKTLRGNMAEVSDNAKPVKWKS
jgi:hypothetical protein